jgi:hypothetical protein
MKLSGDHWSGRIYNADDGQTYASDISLVDAKTLKVSGCVLIICGLRTLEKTFGDSESRIRPIAPVASVCRRHERRGCGAAQNNQPKGLSA